VDERRRRERITDLAAELVAIQTERALTVDEVAPLARLVARYNTRAHMRTPRYRANLAAGIAAAAALGDSRRPIV
jgi:hypothetical protein